jgi:hypothetical protein
MNIPIVYAAVVAAALSVGIGAITVNAADTGLQVALLTPSQPDSGMPRALTPEADIITLSAPPRDSEEEGRRRFEPLAEYLSKTLGKKVVYRHPGSWGVYQGAMQKGAYDLVFDGPHFNGWRMEKLDYSVLVKAPGDFSQVVVVRKDNTASDLKRLAGRKVCAHEPPNLGTLIMQGAFDNPARQPLIVVVHGISTFTRAARRQVRGGRVAEETPGEIRPRAWRHACRVPEQTAAESGVVRGTADLDRGPGAHRRRAACARSRRADRENARGLYGRETLRRHKQLRIRRACQVPQ